MTTNKSEMLHIVDASFEPSASEMVQTTYEVAESLTRVLELGPVAGEADMIDALHLAIQQLEEALDIVEARQALLEIHPMFAATLQYLTVTKRYEPVTVEALFHHLKRKHLIERTDTSDTVLAEVLGWANAIECDAAEHGRIGAIIYDEATDTIGFAAPNKEILLLDIEQQRARKLGQTPVLRALNSPTR